MTTGNAMCFSKYWLWKFSKHWWTPLLCNTLPCDWQLCLCNTVQYFAIMCNTPLSKGHHSVLQYCAILCNTEQYWVKGKYLAAILYTVRHSTPWRASVSVQFYAILKNTVQICAILWNIVPFCPILCNTWWMVNTYHQSSTHWTVASYVARQHFNFMW